jgi:hypothetical protein
MGPGLYRARGRFSMELFGQMEGGVHVSFCAGFDGLGNVNRRFDMNSVKIGELMARREAFARKSVPEPRSWTKKSKPSRKNWIA